MEITANKSSRSRQRRLMHMGTGQNSFAHAAIGCWPKLFYCLNIGIIVIKRSHLSNNAREPSFENAYPPKFYGFLHVGNDDSVFKT